jgi:AcrR family transcriptional regulator
MHTGNLPAGQRRAVIIATVVELAGSLNPGDITTAAIARHMNLTQGALFRHFVSKEAIWLAVMEWVAGSLHERIESAIRPLESPLAALEAMFMAHVDFVAAHPGVPRILFGELQHAESSPVRQCVCMLLQGYGERLQRLLGQGQSVGEVAPQLDIDAAATLFIGTLQGLVMQSMLVGDLQRIRQQAPSVFALYLNAIRSTR